MATAFGIAAAKKQIRDFRTHGRQRNRLSLMEAYDRYGFYSYHLAEHHGRPPWSRPFARLISRCGRTETNFLRFGPLVYSLPLYHPIRLIEEVSMLDQMSGGRFELGVGRSVSPITQDEVTVPWNFSGLLGRVFHKSHTVGAALISVNLRFFQKQPSRRPSFASEAARAAYEMLKPGVD